MALTFDSCLTLWRKALESEVGLLIVIDPSKFDSVKWYLIKSRRDSGNLRLYEVSFTRPTLDEIWLVRKDRCPKPMKDIGGLNGQ